MKTLIFVVGMGRSGTSALTRLLSLSGAALPDTLIGPDAGNPTGHWEPALALRINELYLAAGGSSFWDAGLRVQTAEATVSRKAFIQKIRWFLQNELVRGDVFVLKDPRTSVLLDCWLAAAAEAGFTSKVIHIFRRPDEVAASLKARDHLDRAHAYLLWVKYNLLSERDARGWLRAVVSYDALLDDWQGQLRRLIDTLDLSLTTPPGPTVDAFLTPALRHHTAPAQIIEDPTPDGWAERIFAMLGAALDGEIDTAGMDGVFAEFAAWDAARRDNTTFHPDAVSRLLNQLRYTRAGLHLHRWRHRLLGAPRGDAERVSRP